MVQTWNRIKSFAESDVIWYALVATGIVLRLRQYFANRSLWGDEASLAFNIVARSLVGLTEPLGFHQAAPLGFLFIEKLSIVLLWNADYILRLFPLFAGILSIYLFYRIAKENFGAAGRLAVFMFSVNPSLIFYSSELKQYSSDVMVAALLTYLALPCLKEDARRKDFVWLGIGGALTIWASHISIFILAGIGLTLVIEKIIQKKYKSFVETFGVGVAWLVSFGVEYLVALRYTAADKYFQTYWKNRFMPLPPWSDLQWFAKTAYSFLLIIINRTDQIAARLVFTLILVGVLTLFIRKRSVALIVVFSLIMTLLASAMQKYPLSYRFMLFLLPFALLLMAEGIGGIYWFVARWRREVALILCAIPVALLLWFSIPNAIGGFNSPYTVAEIKPIMKYVAEKRKAEDKIYLYYGVVPGFIYYAPFYNLNQLDAGALIMGAYRQDENKAFARFIEDVKGLEGNGRVWFIFSEIANCGGCRGDVFEFFKNYLGKFGTRLDQVQSINSAAYLYDLSP